MSISLATVVARADRVLVREVGDEVVLLNLATETYHGLDDVGAAMWHAACAGPDLSAAADRLATMFDVPPDELHRDLLRLVGELVGAGLLVVA